MDGTALSGHAGFRLSQQVPKISNAGMSNAFVERPNEEMIQVFIGSPPKTAGRLPLLALIALLSLSVGLSFERCATANICPVALMSSAYYT